MYYNLTLLTLLTPTGDDVPDVLIHDKQDQSNQGAIYIACLDPSGAVLSQNKIGSNEGGFEWEIPSDSYWGSSSVGLSDLAGDGLPVIAVG